ncbi:MAG: hypothetical protein Fur0021_17440 [Candidatus Promineifilaceae bacterium]
MSELLVELDNRVRLVGAVLAGSHWPELEQAQTVHAVHPQAKLTRQFIAAHTHHAAIQAANAALQADTPVADLFTAALNSQWPTFTPTAPLPDSFAAAAWLEALADFYVDTAIAAFFWAEQTAPWEEAQRDLRQILPRSLLPTFLARLNSQPLPYDICVIPNLTYPALQPVLGATPPALCFILPPPKAVGESYPWSYREDADWVLAETCYQLCAHILQPILVPLNETEQATLLHAAVAVFLGEVLGSANSQAYIISSKRQFHLPQLPAAVAQLQSHLASPTTAPLATLVNHSPIRQFTN